MCTTTEQHGTGPDKILFIMGCVECAGRPDERLNLNLGSTPPRLLGWVRWNTLQTHTPSSSLTTEVLETVVALVALTRWFYVL